LKVKEWRRSSRKLRHLGTSVHVDEQAEGLRYGQVLWGREASDQMVGLAWDWREVMPEVIALADPMTVLSNLRLLDERGGRLSDAELLLQLNNTIYSLGWQDLICTTRRSWREALAA
jgi:hypothetical protein